MKPWLKKLSAPEQRELYSLFPRSFGVEIECGISRSAYRKPSLNKKASDCECKYDASLRTPNFEREFTIRINTPSRLKDLWALLQYISQHKGMVNSTCGLHVHIGVPEIAGKSANVKYAVAELIERYYYEQEEFVDKLCGRSGTDYAKRGKSALLLGTKYYAINVQTIDHLGTIEFRQMAGTLDYDKIVEWVLFLQQIVDRAVKATVSH